MENPGDQNLFAKLNTESAVNPCDITLLFHDGGDDKFDREVAYKYVGHIWKVVGSMFTESAPYKESGPLDRELIKIIREAKASKHRNEVAQAFRVIQYRMSTKSETEYKHIHSRVLAALFSCIVTRKLRKPTPEKDLWYTCTGIRY